MEEFRQSAIKTLCAVDYSPLAQAMQQTAQRMSTAIWFSVIQSLQQAADIFENILHENTNTVNFRRAKERVNYVI